THDILHTRSCAGLRCEANDSRLWLRAFCPATTQEKATPLRRKAASTLRRYFAPLSSLAQASATPRLGSALPGNVAQPPLATNESWLHESTALSATSVALESAACWNLSTQIGVSAVTTAASALASAMRVALLPSIQPPQPKPTIKVMTQPAAAPCIRRLRDSPCRMRGNCMSSPFARRVFGARTNGHPDGFRPLSWSAGPAALRWRF